MASTNLKSEVPSLLVWGTVVCCFKAEVRIIQLVVSLFSRFVYQKYQNKFSGKQIGRELRREQRLKGDQFCTKYTM